VRDIFETKRAAREAAMAARVAAHAAHPGAPRIAAGYALAAIGHLRDVVAVSGYLPIRSELDPGPAMLALHGLGFGVCVPVIVGPGQPLLFRSWRPGVATERGPFGVEVPVGGETVEPDVLLVPMLAFDPRGHRLGYGGGFYDRTIEAARARGPVTALGFAYAAQEVPEVPNSERDMRLDGVVTEEGLRWTGPE
jgi:5-formyltetrahydrofolate cyclo-ligase